MGRGWGRGWAVGRGWGGGWAAAGKTRGSSRSHILCPVQDHLPSPDLSIPSSSSFVLQPCCWLWGLLSKSIQSQKTEGDISLDWRTLHPTLRRSDSSTRRAWAPSGWGRGLLKRQEALLLYLIPDTKIAQHCLTLACPSVQHVSP